MRKKTILLTGCRGGFGKDTAVVLAKRGHRVIATTHFENSAEGLRKFFAENKLSIEVFKLDVTVPEDRAKIAEYDLDVLVNNAGAGESGSLAEVPLDKVRNDFEVNVFGSLALSQIALKKMMGRDKGTVVFVSSLAGRVAEPFLGSYCMTKFALSAGGEAMRQEIHKVRKNVHIALIEPGAYHTGFNQKNIAKKYAWMDENSYFYNMIDGLKRRENAYFGRYEMLSNASIVRKIVKACEADRPKLRYSAPWWQHAGIQIMRIFGK